MVRKALCVGTLIAAAASGAIDARAATVTFSFDPSYLYNSSSTPSSNPSGVAGQSLQNYMTNTWTAGGGTGSVTVMGAGVLSNNIHWRWACDRSGDQYEQRGASDIGFDQRWYSAQPQ